MEDIFRGILSPAFQLGEGPFILFPTYIVPLEVFSRGMMTRTNYTFFTALVDAVNGSVSLYPPKSLVVVESGPPDGKTLEAKVSGLMAIELAESAGRCLGKEKWTAAFRYNSVKVDREKLRATWRVWKVEGETVVDTLTGRRENLGTLVAAILGEILPEPEVKGS